MLLRNSLVLAVCLLAAASARADGENDFQARFRDGTVIGRAALQEPIEIVTRFGKLTIPAKDVDRIEFGLRMPEDAAKKVEQAIAHLGSGNFKEREQASKTLIELGVHAHAALQKAVGSADKEVVRRAREALEKVRANTPEKLLNAKPEDTVHAAGSMIVGKIVGSAFKAKTANFGELTFRLGDLKSLQNRARMEKALAVDLSKQSGTWIDTGIDCDPAMGLRIVTSGGLKVDGAGGGLPGGVVPGLPPGAGPGGVFQPEQPVGILAYIGAGPPTNGNRGRMRFWVGNRIEGKAPRKGRLYLKIAAPRAPGTVKVKINVLPDYQGNSTIAGGDGRYSTPIQYPEGVVTPPPMAVPFNPVAPMPPDAPPMPDGTQ